MITVDEAWSVYDTRTEPCKFDKKSYGIDVLDIKISSRIDPHPGFFAVGKGKALYVAGCTGHGIVAGQTRVVE